MNYQTFTNEAKALNVTALITETLVSPSDNRTIQICKYLKIKKANSRQVLPFVIKQSKHKFLWVCEVT